MQTHAKHTGEIQEPQTPPAFWGDCLGLVGYQGLGHMQVPCGLNFLPGEHGTHRSTYSRRAHCAWPLVNPQPGPLAQMKKLRYTQAGMESQSCGETSGEGISGEGISAAHSQAILILHHLSLSPFLSDIPTSLDPPSKPTQGEELQGQQEKATDPSPPSAQPLPQDPPQKSDGRRTCCRGWDRSRAWAQRNFRCSRGRGREGAGLHLYSWAEGGPRLGSLEGCFSMEDTGSEKFLPQPGRGWWEDTGLDL